MKNLSLPLNALLPFLVLMADTRSPGNLFSILPHSESSALQDMIWNDGALFVVIVVGILDPRNPQVVKACNAKNVE